jgi:hypothetical protein
MSNITMLPFIDAVRRRHSRLTLDVFFWLLCGALLYTVPATATSIVVIRIENGFVMAADSGLTDNSGEPLPQLACKVRTAGHSIVFAYGGLMGTSTFRTDEELEKVVSSSNSAITAAKKIEEAIIPILTREAKLLRREAPDKFAYLLRGNDILQVFIVTAQAAILQGYFVNVESDGAVVVSLSGTKNCIAGSPTCGVGKIMRLGEDAEIVKFVNSKSGGSIDNLTDYAKLLVGLEIAGSPKTVRAPIDLLEITNNGIAWKQQKAECK